MNNQVKLLLAVLLLALSTIGSVEASAPPNDQTKLECYACENGKCIRIRCPGTV